MNLKNVSIIRNTSTLKFLVGLIALNTVPILAMLINYTTVSANSSLSSNKIQQLPNLIAQQQICRVVNIKTGQLALRFTPNGKSRAGLNNRNTVAFLQRGGTPWAYVRVISGPNSQVNGLEGWVNAQYLSCAQDTEVVSTRQVFCDVVNIKTGQLALRFTPNGKSRAGLNNGNVIKWLRQGSGPWVYVRVLEGPNSGVNGLEGWVNSNYLSCYDDA
ncbi:MAG: SH3 domain-containing protein [Scytonema sp. PMC 1069.18]|nr:SH3 domain-containing protein [Scytonema sp. PMC 1069.18]MEC4888071.1 SH3 domain-containing protein [Scytonema sp. PMC 1070.18]